MVYILLADGFEEMEALVPADLLRRAGAEVALVSVAGQEFVTGLHGVAVKADLSLCDASVEAGEMVVLPGGAGWRNGASPETEVLVRGIFQKGGWATAICAAPTLLGSFGLLDGRRAVCYPGMEDGLTGAVVCKGEQVVRDDNLITGEGPGSAYPFALALVEALKGPAALEQVRGETYYRG